MTRPPRVPRILQVCAVDFTARRFLLPLMRAQRQAGFEVHLACRPGEDLGPITHEGFAVHPIAFERSFNVLAHLKAYRALRRLLAAEPFDVVHTHTPVASLIARPAARRSGVPLVVYTAHGFYFHDAMRPWMRRVHISLERWAQRRADFLFTQSAEDLETALCEAIAPRSRAMAIGNGVDLSLFDPQSVDSEAVAAARREFGLSEGQGPVIVMIGRLVREKGYFEFLEAMGRLKESYPGVRALVIGDALATDHDDSANLIRQRAGELGLGETVIFAGLRSDVPVLLALGDVYCLPSWREGMPRSIIEAMAAGLPVVATDIRGCREEVVDGQTGLLVPPRDAEALALALERLGGDSALRVTMGREGGRRARELYDEARVIERQMECLKRLFTQQAMAWPGA